MDQGNIKKKTKSQQIARVQSKIALKKIKTQLNDLIEVNEDEVPEDEDIQNISFSLSNCDDMNDLLENFTLKSEEKIELEYENTTNQEGLAIIEDFLRDSTKQILNSKKGFDEDIKKTSSEFYNDLIQNLNLPKDVKKNSKFHYLDKTKNTNYMTKSESITSDDQTKFKNDLIGQTFEHKDSDFGKNPLKTKTSMSNEKFSSQYIAEEDEEDKMIEIRKKKVVNFKENKK